MPTLYSYYRRSGGNTPDGTGDERFELDYNYSTDYANNCDNFTMSLYMRTAYWDSSQISVNGRTILDGVTQSFSKTISGSGSNRYLIGTKTQTVYHNSDGSKQCYIQGQGLEFAFGYSYLGTENRLLTLPNIPRYANITSYVVANGGLSSLNVTWNADAYCDAVQYSLNGGGWIDVSGTSFTINGLQPGTQYAVKIRVRRTDNQLWTESTIKYVTTLDIARITNAPNFNDEQNPTINFTNQSGSTINVRLEATGLSIRRDNISNTGQYTFELTSDERRALQNYMPSSNTGSIRFTIATVVNGSEAYWNWQDKTLSITNANPQFSNFTYEDINTITKELTNDNQIIVKGYSNLRAIVSVANQAVAQKGATMSKYRLVVGSKQIDVDYSASSDVYLDLNAIDNNVFTVYAIDSRGNSTAKQISPAQYKDYSPISIASASALRTDSIEEETTLTLNGTIWNDNFGSTGNSIISCTYKYKKVQDTTYIDGTTPLTPIISGNTYSLSALIAGDDGALGFNIGSSYDVQITVTDRLSTKTYDLQPLQTAKPRMDICEDMGVAFGGVYDDVLGGALQVEVDNTNYKALTTKDINTTVLGAETVLYNNATGTTGTVTLSDSSANYNYLKIFFNKSGCNGYQEVYSPNGKTVSLLVSNSYGNGVIQNIIKQITISGTNIVTNYSNYTNFSGSTVTTAVTSGTDTISITRVVGYR